MANLSCKKGQIFIKYATKLLSHQFWEIIKQNEKINEDSANEGVSIKTEISAYILRSYNAFQKLYPSG